MRPNPLILWIFCIAQAQAQENIQPSDFNFTATLSEGRQSLRQFELPYAVFSGLQREDYGDMRIFNQQNQAVPFVVSEVSPQTEQKISDRTLRFFPLAQQAASQSATQISFSDQTTHFQLNSVTDKSKPPYLLIENPHQTDALQSLQLLWQQAASDANVKVSVDSSDDLQTWQAIQTGVTLYDLKHADTALLQNTVPLPEASHAKYLRLAFEPVGNVHLQIEKVRAHYQQSRVVERETWQTFPLSPGKSPNEWRVNTHNLAPVVKVGLVIPKAGLFYQGSLYSQSEKPLKNKALNDYWQYQSDITQYRLASAAGEIQSEPFAIAPTKQPHWKVVLQQPPTLLPEQVPQIRFAWQPVRVTFLAQGQPPFRLCFGQASVAPLNANLPRLLDAAVETVSVSAIQALAKTPTKTANAQKTLAESVDWQTLLLWGVLGSGVGLMGWMAYKLYASMNVKNS